MGIKNIIKLDYSKIKDWRSEVKFNVEVFNPPYKNGLHMKILEKGYDLLADNPSTNFINIKKTNTAHSGITDKIKNDVVDLQMINGNEMFDAGFFAPCSITHVHKGYNKPEVDVTFMDGKKVNFSSIEKVNIWGEEEVVFSLLDKIEKYSNLDDQQITEEEAKTLPFIADLAQIRGHVSKAELTTNDFHTFIPRDYTVKTGEADEFKHIIFGFQTEQEAQNFINYLKTNFARRALSLYKINSQLSTGELKAVPWLDFTQEWSDEKLAKEFELTQEEIDFVNEIPQYY
jgi:hypothetical protein